jgi:hypothetical protein
MALYHEQAFYVKSFLRQMFALLLQEGVFHDGAK